MLRRLLRSVLVLLLMALLAGLAQFSYLCWRVNHTGTRDQAQSAEAILVLGARVERDGQPGPDLRSRTLHGVGLFARGLAPYLVCTGGFEGDRLSAASVCRRLAVSRGVPSDRVLLADGSMTTGEDAASAAHLMTRNGWDTAILVSHPLHLERAQLLFRAEGVTTYPSPTSTSLEAIPWRTRAALTVREALAIAWIGLLELGAPEDWTSSLRRYVYGWVPATEDE